MQWYYAKGGVQSGPVGVDELKAKIAAGEVGPTDLAWRDGMGDWVPVAQLAELRVEAAGESLSSAEQASGTNVAGVPYQAPVSQGMPAAYSPTMSQAPATCGKATASMVLGICSLVFSLCACAGLILAILAVVFGSQAKTEIARRPELASDLGKAKAGVVMGIIGIALSVLSGIVGFIIQLGQSGQF